MSQEEQDEQGARPPAARRRPVVLLVALAVLLVGGSAAGVAVLGDDDEPTPVLTGSPPTSDEPPSSPPPPSTPPVPTDPGPRPGWRVGLDEDFDTLDPARWNVRGPESYERDLSRVLPENTTVEGGRLRMRATDVPTGDRPYTGADMETYDRFSLPASFRLEVRAKVPFQPGLWPAPLWMRPADLGDGEIDVAEMFGGEDDEPAVHQTVHSEYGPTHEQEKAVTPYADLGLDPTAWHTYTVEKVRGSITMWVDGIQTARFTPDDTPFFRRIFDRGDRWALRVSLQVGGPGGEPGAGNDWSPAATTLLVDRIRAWVPPAR